METMIDAMVNRIVERFHPLRVIVFGSQGRGTATATSDGAGSGKREAGNRE